MARRRRGGRRGFRVGKWVNLAFKGIATAVGLSPAIDGVKIMLTGDVKHGGAVITRDYTGINIETGQFEPQGALKGLGALIGAVLISKIGGFLARRF